LSIAKTALKETDGKVVLVYGNRSEDDKMFAGELQALQTAYRQRFEIVHIYSRRKTTDALFGRYGLS